MVPPQAGALHGRPGTGKPLTLVGLRGLLLSRFPCPPNPAALPKTCESAILYVEPISKSGWCETGVELRCFFMTGVTIIGIDAINEG
jgi:hypothetical protein